MSHELNLACVLIAAGNSSRLGQSKQLIEIENTTLLNRTISLAEAITDKVLVVLGSEPELHQDSINSNAAKIEINRNWHVGMGSSIAKGVSSLSSECDSVLILLCDQWALKQDDLKQLKAQWLENPDRIICSQYLDLRVNKQVLGAPAIFPHSYFDQLLSLKKTGARKILQENPQDLIAVELPNAGYDLDTPEDLQNLLALRTSSLFPKR